MKGLKLGLCCLMALPFLLFAKTNVLVSTDTANGLWDVSHSRPMDTDDGLAILDLSHQTPYHIATLVVQFGNSDRDRQFKVAQHLVKLMGLPIPVVKGAAQPLAKTGPVPVTPGAKYMANYLKDHKAVILGIAPVTDIASLLANFPQVRHNIIHIYVEVGRTVPKPLTLGPKHAPVLEMNYVKDSRAADIVMHSHTPVTVLSFGAIQASKLYIPDYKKITAHNTPASRWVAKTLYPWSKYWVSRFDSKGTHPWDAVVVYYMMHPQGFHCQMLPSAIIPSNYSAAFLKKYPGMKAETTWLMFGSQYKGEKQLYCGSVDPSLVPKINAWVVKYAY